MVSYANCGVQSFFTSQIMKIIVSDEFCRHNVHTAPGCLEFAQSPVRNDR